jgi:hypothetical protein
VNESGDKKVSAVLRAEGVEFDPDRFCSESGLTPYMLWRKGEPRSPRSEGKLYEDSGFNLDVSDADFLDLPRQVEDAIAFLEGNHKKLSRLCGFPGIETVTLDFGIARRDVFAQFHRFPPTLIRLAGELGLGIELSQYWCSDEEESDTLPDGESSVE